MTEREFDQKVERAAANFERRVETAAQNRKSYVESQPLISLCIQRDIPGC